MKKCCCSSLRRWERAERWPGHRRCLQLGSPRLLQVPAIGAASLCESRLRRMKVNCAASIIIWIVVDIA